MGSYDNDWLFLDDDLFVVFVDEIITVTDEKPVCDRFVPLNNGEDDSDAVATV